MLNFQDILIKLVVVAIWFANADSKGKETILIYNYIIMYGLHRLVKLLDWFKYAVFDIKTTFMLKIISEWTIQYLRIG